MSIDVHQPLQTVLNAEMSLPGASVYLHTIEIHGMPYEVVANRPHTELTYVEPITHNTPEATAYFDISDRHIKPSKLGRVVLRPGELKMRAFGSGTGSSRILMCSFEDDYFSRVTGLRQWSERMLTRCGNLQSTAVAAIMRRMLVEMKSAQFGGQLALESLTNLALIEIGRLFLSEKSSLPSRRRLAPWQIRKIEESLREVVNHWPSLNELAALCGISAKHLSRTFSESTGMPLSKYSEQIRMERAQRLLSEPHLAVKDVAAILGFSNANYFSAAFHHATGETAREFINRL